MDGDGDDSNTAETKEGGNGVSAILSVVRSLDADIHLVAQPDHLQCQPLRESAEERRPSRHDDVAHERAADVDVALVDGVEDELVQPVTVELQGMALLSSLKTALTTANNACPLRGLKKISGARNRSVSRLVRMVSG